MIMNKEMILKSDVIDSLFEHKNKAYGAYELRRHYPPRLRKALLIMLESALAFSTLAFLPGKKRVRVIDYSMNDHVLPPVAKPTEKQPEKQPEKKVNKTKQPQQKWVSNIAIVSSKQKTDSLNNLNELPPIGSVTINTGGPSVFIPVDPGPVEPVQPAAPVKPVSGPISDPEIMPGYPGGMDALHRFLERNLQNPKDLEEGQSVSVHVKFVVGFDGKLGGFDTDGQANSEFYQEVVRVLKKMPAWIPGRSNGEKVSVYYTIPVKFVPAE